MEAVREEVCSTCYSARVRAALSAVPGSERSRARAPGADGSGEPVAGRR